MFHAMQLVILANHVIQAIVEVAMAHAKHIVHIVVRIAVVVILARLVILVRLVTLLNKFDFL